MTDFAALGMCAVGCLPLTVLAYLVCLARRDEDHALTWSFAIAANVVAALVLSRLSQ